MKKQIPLILAAVWWAGSMPSHAQSPLTNYTALYVFGDSFAATSGGPYCGGKWSNGPMWPELLSTNLGFAYQPRNNCAVGGTTSAQILSQARSLPAPTNAASALFVVCLGNNDFGSSWPIASDLIWSNVTRAAVLNWSNSVAACYQKGARTVVALNFLDFNLSPALARAVSDHAYVRRKTIEANTALRAARGGLRDNYPDLRLVTIDHFGAGNLLATNFASFGFTRIDLGALEDPLLSDKSCNGPGRNYFFWDGAHPTSKAHALFADLVLAALQGARMTLAETHIGFDGFWLKIEPVQLGRTYHLQPSTDVMHWEDMQWQEFTGSFTAAGFTWRTGFPLWLGGDFNFYRLTSDD